jgi:hypothetical protein
MAYESCGLDERQIVAGARGDEAAPEAGAAYFATTAGLSLSFTPDTISVGNNATVRTAGGTPGAPVMLTLIEAGGVPMFLPIPILGTFDSNGRGVDGARTVSHLESF